MKAVTYSPASQSIVDAYNIRENADKNAAYWSDDETAAVRKEIKDHYIAEQSHKCAYCLKPILSNNNAVWDGEHIISKAKNPEFMFEPMNLAISCKDCNGAKLEQEVRVTKKKSFPKKASEYGIVHPHFDNYDDHIGWLGEICFAKSLGKGPKTIAMCNLSRYAALTIGGTTNILDNRFAGLMATLMKAETPDDAEIVLAGIKQFLVVKNRK